MARTASRAAERDRPIQQWPSTRIAPLLFGVLLLLAGIWIWQRGDGTVHAGVVAPIATLTTTDAHALVWSPNEITTVFVGYHNGLLKSTDGGRTWQPTSLTDADAMSLAASPKAPARLYAAGHAILRRSDDGGETWTAPQSVLQGADIHGLAQSPVDSDRLYALVADQGLFTSSDGGRTWTFISSAPSQAALAVSADGQTLLLGAGSVIRQSTDQGVSWQPSGTELPQDAQVLALAVDPTGNRVFAATTAGLYRRTEPGGIWEPTPLNGTIVAVAVSPALPDTMLAIDDEKQIFRSLDGGGSWSLWVTR